MSAHMKTHLINNEDVIRVYYKGNLYLFPIKIAEKYRVSEQDDVQSSTNDDVFASINKKYSKPGALLRGIRIREQLTQIQLAKKLNVTQSDISQIERGTRKIGRTIAKRIETLFGVNYRSFLE